MNNNYMMYWAIVAVFVVLGFTVVSCYIMDAIRSVAVEIGKLRALLTVLGERNAKR
jgi:hypothetical protein